MKPLIMREHVKKIAYKNINIWRSYSNLNEAIFREAWSFAPGTVKIGLTAAAAQSLNLWQNFTTKGQICPSPSHVK